MRAVGGLVLAPAQSQATGRLATSRAKLHGVEDLLIAGAAADVAAEALLISSRSANGLTRAAPRSQPSPCRGCSSRTGWRRSCGTPAAARKARRGVPAPRPVSICGALRLGDRHRARLHQHAVDEYRARRRIRRRRSPPVVPVRPRSSRRKSSSRRWRLALRARLWRPLTVASMRRSGAGRLQFERARRSGRRRRRAPPRSAAAARSRAPPRGGRPGAWREQRDPPRMLGGCLPEALRRDLGLARRNASTSAATGTGRCPDGEGARPRMRSGGIELHQRRETDKRDHQRAAMADLLEAAAVARPARRIRPPPAARPPAAPSGRGR